MELDILHQILSKLISMESDIKDLKQGQSKLEQSVNKLEQGQAKLEQNYFKLEQVQAETNAKLDELMQFAHSIHIHQELDFKLLESVSEKVEHLVTISEDHERRLQKLEA